jgi:hypothetical protein
MAVIAGIPGMYDYTYDTMDAVGVDVPGAAQVSLGDLLGNPAASLPQLQRNLMNNYQAILVGSFFTALSFKVAKKVLAKPIRKINTGLFGKRGIIGHIGFKL